MITTENALENGWRAAPLSIRPRTGAASPLLMATLAVTMLALISWFAGIHGPLMARGPLSRDWIGSALSTSGPPAPQAIVGNWHGRFGGKTNSTLVVDRNGISNPSETVKDSQEIVPSRVDSTFAMLDSVAHDTVLREDSLPAIGRSVPEEPLDNSVAAVADISRTLVSFEMGFRTVTLYFARECSRKTFEPEVTTIPPGIERESLHWTTSRRGILLVSEAGVVTPIGLGEDMLHIVLKSNPHARDSLPIRVRAGCSAW